MFMEKMFDNFIQQYPLSKTLRFELKPQGETKENIHKAGLLSKDYQRAVDYKRAKELIDEYHKKFIITSLQAVDIDWEPLKKALYNFQESQKTLSVKKNNKNVSEKDIDSTIKNFEKTHKDLTIIQTKSRVALATFFSNQTLYKDMFDAKILTKILPEFLTGRDIDKNLILSFKGFTTYFKGFHENRKNIYSSDEKNTGFAYRAVNVNFPKFYDNMFKYQTIRDKYPEVLKGINTDNIFTLPYYNKVLIQDGINNYNKIIGEINKSLNLYRQKYPDNKSLKRLYMMTLFKQILGDSEKMYSLPDMFETGQEATETLMNFYRRFMQDEILTKVKNLFINLNNYDTAGIFIKDVATLSQNMYGYWGQIQTLRYEQAQMRYPELNKINRKNIEVELSSDVTLEDILSLPIPEDNPPQTIETIVNEICDGIIAKYKPLEDIYINGKDVLTEGKSAVKDFLDEVLKLTRFMKLFSAPENYICDPLFYEQYNNLMSGWFVDSSMLYDKIRNYVTRKPYKEDKIKLMFDFPTFMDGWDYNREQSNGAVLLLKEGKYYLGIMNHKNKVNINKAPESDKGYLKVFYKQIPNPTLDFPKNLLTSGKAIQRFAPNNELLLGYESKKHIQGDSFDLEFCHQLINYFKKCIPNYPGWEVFEFKFSDTSTYKNISEFYNEAKQQSYVLKYERYISEEYINECVRNEQLYLFEIYNKDFAHNAKGTKNIHTLYWEGLFNTTPIFKLNGEAELFYRPASIDEPVVHAKGSILVNRRDKQGTPIPNNIYKELCQYFNGGEKTELIKPYLEKAITKMATHDIIKDKRYSQDKFLFHVPITINYNAPSTKDLNLRVLKVLKDNPNMNIIGIDRGERHLLYVSVINQKGEIIKQKSLNVINEYDYQMKLSQRNDERKESRQNWETIGSIKELKAGYLSVTIHEIVKLMIDYNAILVMESLDPKFTRTRGKFEYNVYQKFEKMLIEKLNYLVFKTYKPQEKGGLFNGYQLTRQIKPKEKIGRQCGFLFYVPAGYTSKIDPATGFVSLINCNYANIEQSQIFFGQFEKILFNQSEDYFEFHVNHKNLPTFQQDYTNKWVICTYGENRYSYSPKEKKVQTVNVSQELKNLFSQYEIDIYGDLKEAICNQTVAKFYERLSFLFKLTLQMRYSNRETGEDFILSPVKNKQGEFFMSCPENEIKKLPTDGDANGAYHIALKGLQLITNISENYKLPNITTADWFKYAQQRHQEK